MMPGANSENESDMDTMGSEGYCFCAGIDEAGRGPLAGPVTAACVVFPEGYTHPRITDSKKLSAKVRDTLFGEIVHDALAYAVVSVGPRRIEKLNILQATHLAMRLCADRVHEDLRRRVPSGKPVRLHLQIDGNSPIETKFSQETIVKGDSKVLSIGAASILAKVSRDRLMELLDAKYPDYGFRVHKGYPTAAHLAAVARFGPCVAHRRTFAGVAEHCTQLSFAAFSRSPATAARR